MCLECGMTWSKATLILYKPASHGHRHKYLSKIGQTRTVLQSPIQISCKILSQVDGYSLKALNFGWFVM